VAATDQFAPVLPRCAPYVYGPASTLAAIWFTHSEATAEKVAWVRQAAGERFAGLELHALAPFVAVTDAPGRAAEQIAQQWRIANVMSPAALLASPHALIGSEDGIVEALHERRERYRISYVTVFAPAMETFAPVVARLTGR
jgi:hypothetical protein